MEDAKSCGLFQRIAQDVTDTVVFENADEILGAHSSFVSIEEGENGSLHVCVSV
jgi:hypothetical protein